MPSKGHVTRSIIIIIIHLLHKVTWCDMVNTISKKIYMLTYNSINGYF